MTNTRTCLLAVIIIFAVDRRCHSAAMNKGEFNGTWVTKKAMEAIKHIPDGMQDAKLELEMFRKSTNGVLINWLVVMSSSYCDLEPCKNTHAIPNWHHPAADGTHMVSLSRCTQIQKYIQISVFVFFARKKMRNTNEVGHLSVTHKYAKSSTIKWICVFRFFGLLCN